ncbi:MAG: glycoside hydrolase family 127 protein [Victivallales bacterium]|nr:glycoside hydrolase family 127 protein [Victivallales bacterium]
MSIKLKDRFFAPRQASNITVTIPSAIKRCEETGRIEAFKLNWTPGCDKPMPHIFWDSDVAKVMEGMAYVSNQPGGEKIKERLDELVRLVVSAQQPDGYLNTHFTVTEQDKRWTNLFNWHELYCAGHLTEAAVAHYQATGNRLFLDAMCRYVDYIWSVFGEGGREGYPGHEEIELALCKLYKVTGNPMHLKLAKLFIDRRGTKPNYYVEKEHMDAGGLPNRQAHIPVREQTEAVGHAVRAVYLYSGMADIAALTGDKELLDACKRLFDSITQHRMAITGGIGSNPSGEAFCEDDDLPNDRTYNESCASIGLVLFASRMLALTNEEKYADVIERCIFNGALSGISLKGDSYFYVNRLEYNNNTLQYSHASATRQPWYNCSCCPTNYCRFLPQLGNFCYRATKDMLAIDIPVAASVDTDDFAVDIASDYPYDGKVAVTIRRGGKFTLAIRIPAWCEDNPVLPAGGEIVNGYWKSLREWKTGETLNITFPMQVKRIICRAPADIGKVALTRGPIVYCVEAPENAGYAPIELSVPANANFELVPVEALLPGTVGIRFTAQRRIPSSKLYSSEAPATEPKTVTAIPYALWQNRGNVQMSVYMMDAR